VLEIDLHKIASLQKRLKATSSTIDMNEPLDLLRFQADLEFLQSLANPVYINCTAPYV